MRARSMLPTTFTPLAPLARLLRLFLLLIGLQLSLAAPAQTVAPSAAPAGAGGLVDAARGPIATDAMNDPAALRNAVNDDVRRPRNYDMQPPTIPHRVDGYQIDKNFNKCLDCHARGKTTFTQAIPVSPTHYLDRSGKALDRISTRRYFCMQCHVAQDPVNPIVGNTFQGVAFGVPGAAAPAAAPSAASNPAASPAAGAR